MFAVNTCSVKLFKFRLVFLHLLIIHCRKLALANKMSFLEEPVPRNFFISDLEYFTSNLIFAPEIFVKYLNKAGIFLKIFIFHLISNQNLAKSMLFMLEKSLLLGLELLSCDCRVSTANR